MTKSVFKPHHINVSPEDLAGNQGIGRYILLPGSDGRAKEIAEHFNNVLVKTHPRGHHLYLGDIENAGTSIKVATISSGMGCPSMEIILHELFHLGAKRFLRVGTAGSLQPKTIKFGDMINASASIRDEGTTVDYVPLSIPAISSYEFTSHILSSAHALGLKNQVHTGIVHCKSSFYARQFGVGPLGDENREYIKLLTQCGVLATEMETATLFIQSHLYDHQLKQQGKGLLHRVLAGAILGIIGVSPSEFATTDQTKTTIDNLISLALETIKTLGKKELLALKDESYESTDY